MLSYWDILQAHEYCLFNLTCITSMQLTSPTRTITSASQGSLLFTYLIPSLHYNSVFPTSRSHLLIPFIAWSWSAVPICSWVKTKLHCGLSQLQSMRAHILLHMLRTWWLSSMTCAHQCLLPFLAKAWRVCLTLSQSSWAPQCTRIFWGRN